MSLSSLLKENVELPKKLKLFKNSGRPVDPEAEDAYLAEWRLFYDKAEARAGLNAIKLQRFLQYGERLLQKKHYKEVTVEDFEQMREKMIEIGYPILLGIAVDGNELIGIIQDT